MEKRGWILLFVLLFIGNVYAICDTNVVLLNQDPYPAVQGDYVKLVFQVQGVESNECKDIDFVLLPDYPFSLDPGVDASTKIKGGTFTVDYNSFFMVPYKVRVDENAVDGNNTIRYKYSSGNSDSSYLIGNKSIEVKDLKTNFEVFLKDYNSETKILTLEIMNSGKNDVEGLTLEIPSQENIKVKGPNYKIIGSLDSNDFSTATYEVDSLKGEIKLGIYYTDSIYERRKIDKSIYFDPEPFLNRTSKKSNYSWIYLVVILIIIGIGIYFYRKKQKEKRRRLLG